MMNDSICVSCGRYVPEGRMICSLCENESGTKDTLYDRFVKMAKEEFGCTVKRVENNDETFESLFGIPKEEMDMLYLQ